MNIWDNTTGIEEVLGTIVEDTLHVINLPIVDYDSIYLISGSLPPGMRIESNTIQGMPDKVSNITRYSFVLRAIKDENIDDRSFTIYVTGKNSPEWVTPPGHLQMGDPSGMNSFYYHGYVVTYQFIAVDDDIETGENLQYILTDGELPPGLTLTNTGLLYGILGIMVEDSDGKVYDYIYDYPHPDDFIMGYHSNFYDISNKAEILSYTSTLKPISKSYSFTISVSDGKNTPVPRSFYINVAGEDVTVFSAMAMPSTGSIFVHWLTKEDLGVYRGNKYVTIYLDAIFSDTMTGFMDYDLYPINIDGTVSKLPNGLFLDEERGIIYGKTPSFTTPKVDYKFYIGAFGVYKTFYMSIIHENFTDFSWETSSYLGTMKVYQKSYKRIMATPSTSGTTTNFKLVGGELPPGLSLSNNGYINGNVLPLDPGHDGIFNFTINVWNVNNTVGRDKEFEIHVDTVDPLMYNEVYIKAFLPVYQREEYIKFLTDTMIFDEDHLYKMHDSDFGLNTTMDMLLCSSVDNVDLHEYYLLLNSFERRRLKYNGVNYITVYSPGTKTPLYDMVYLDLFDPLTDTNNAFYILRDRIMQLGDSDFRNERLWIRSLRFLENYNSLIAMPLAFTKAGTGELIVKKIQNSNYKLNLYEFDIDRIIVSSSLNDDAAYVMVPVRNAQTFL